MPDTYYFPKKTSYFQFIDIVVDKNNFLYLYEHQCTLSTVRNEETQKYATQKIHRLYKMLDILCDSERCHKHTNILLVQRKYYMSK